MKAFTPEEKDYITQQLVDKGRSNFTKYGIRRTTVEELTKAVGIAKGSFYLFFESKEELYFHILGIEVAQLRAELVKKLIQPGQFPRTVVRSILQGIADAFAMNPIVALSASDEGRNVLERERIKNKLKDDGDIHIGLQALLFELMDRGFIKRQNIQRIENMMRALFIILIHLNDFDKDYTEETITMMIDAIAERLTETKGV